jgi:hypothetical protein
MRERVWAAANVKLEAVTIDTDTTVHTLYGQQMGGRKGYNPKNKGKKSYQPMLTFIAETREYVWGELRNGDRPDGKQIGRHIRNVCAAMPAGVKQIYGRAGPRGHPVWRQLLLRVSDNYFCGSTTTTTLTNFRWPAYAGSDRSRG